MLYQDHIVNPKIAHERNVNYNYRRLKNLGNVVIAQYCSSFFPNFSQNNTTVPK